MDLCTRSSFPWWPDLSEPIESISDVEPEKAILDFLYLHPELKDASGMEALRLNSSELEVLDEQRMNRYLQLFDNKALNKRFGLFKEVKHVGTV